MTGVQTCALPIFMKLINHQRTDRKIFQFVAPVQKTQFDEKSNLQNICAHFFQEFGGGGGGPARGEKIVDEQNAAAVADGIGVNGDRVRAVFEIVTFLVGGERQLALLAHGNKTALQLQRGGGGEDKSARIDSDDGIDIARFKVSAKLVDALGEQPAIGEQRRDVFELNAGFWKIRNIANGLFQIAERRIGCVVHGGRNYGGEKKTAGNFFEGAGINFPCNQRKRNLQPVSVLGVCVSICLFGYALAT